MNYRMLPGGDLIERGHVQDIEDVHAMLKRALIDPQKLERYFDEIEPLRFESSKQILFFCCDTNFGRPQSPASGLKF